MPIVITGHMIVIIWALINRRRHDFNKYSSILIRYIERLVINRDTFAGIISFIISLMTEWYLVVSIIGCPYYFDPFSWLTPDTSRPSDALRSFDSLFSSWSLWWLTYTASWTHFAHLASCAIISGWSWRSLFASLSDMSINTSVSFLTRTWIIFTVTSGNASFTFTARQSWLAMRAVDSLLIWFIRQRKTSWLSQVDSKLKNWFHMNTIFFQ